MQIDELLKLYCETVTARLRTIVIAAVESYDGEVGTVDAKPVVRRHYVHPDRQQDPSPAQPVVPNVPVIWPGGGGFSMRWKLRQGDHVLLLVGERSTDEWRATPSRTDIDPQSHRRFDITDAFAYPLTLGAHASNDLVITCEAGQRIRLGGSGATDFVALSSLVEGHFTALKAWLDTHTHGVVGVGTPGSPVPTTPPTVVSPTSGSVGASKVTAG